jgi:hypothetical protein
MPLRRRPLRLFEMTEHWSPLGGDRDRTAAPVVARGPTSRGAGKQEVDLLVDTVPAAPDAPQREDR